MPLLAAVLRQDRSLPASRSVAMDGIAVDLSTTPIAGMQFQTLFPLGVPKRRVIGLGLKAEILQPEPDVALESP